MTIGYGGGWQGNRIKPRASQRRGELKEKSLVCHGERNHISAEESQVRCVGEVGWGEGRESHLTECMRSFHFIDISLN